MPNSTASATRESSLKSWENSELGLSSEFVASVTSYEVERRASRPSSSIAAGRGRPALHQQSLGADTMSEELTELEEHAEHAREHPDLAPVTLTMAVLAVLVATVSLLGHRTHTEEIILKN